MLMSLHIRSSQYFLQIAKCERAICCAPMRSNWLSVSQQISAGPSTSKVGKPCRMPRIRNRQTGLQVYGKEWHYQAALDMIYDSYYPCSKEGYNQTEMQFM